MKKILAILLGLSFFGSVVACNTGTTGDDDDSGHDHGDDDDSAHS